MSRLTRAPWLVTLVLIIAPTALAAQGLPRRTLLIELAAIEKKDLEQLLPIFGRRADETVVSHVRKRALLVTTQAEADLLTERGYPLTVVLRDTSERILFTRALFGPSLRMAEIYHTYDEILAEGDTLVRRFPSLIAKRVIGRTTQEGRRIIAFKISGTVGRDLDRPRILFTGCHHADEVLGAEICIALMHELVERYGISPEHTDWLERYEIVVVPVLNVDGHAVVTSGIDPRWRKNTRDTNGNGILHEYPEGVDINRNYDFNWAHGGSDDPSSDRYRGEYPFSESENLAMLRLAHEQRFLLSITYHSQGEVVYYPWEWRGRKAPDDALLTETARGLAGSLTTMEGDSTYRAAYGAGTVGQSYPWLYGVFGTFDFVVEAGAGAHIFPQEDVPGIVESNLAGVRYLLNRGKGPGLTGHVTDQKTRKPLRAVVRLPSIETEDVLHRTTDPRTGRYWRLLAPGPTTVIVQCPGYNTKVLRDIRVADRDWTTLDVALTPEKNAGAGE